MSKSKVAIVKTSPATVLQDYHRLMNLADYQSTLAKDIETALKINISWHFFYPGSSTTPWQLDGVIRAMKKDGYDPGKIHGCHNRTVVIDAHLGERENKQVNVTDAHGLANIHLYEGEEWIHIREAVGDLADEFLCLNEVYPDGFMIPKRFIGENILHLPTVKTHVFTTTTGAMKNAFGGLLNEKRHWTHPVIHETLVDLLMIQKKIHSGVFAVMDGTFAGDGPGPRCMIPHVKMCSWPPRIRWRLMRWPRSLWGLIRFRISSLYGWPMKEVWDVATLTTLRLSAISRHWMKSGILSGPIKR